MNRLPNQQVITCTNPKCKRKIIEPILLNDLSTQPSKQYHACPHCLTMLELKTRSHQDDERQSSLSHPSNLSLEKVKNAISTGLHEEKEREPQKEEGLETLKRNEKNGPSGCTHNFGYMANRPEKDPIPQECLICPKVVDCMMKKNSLSQGK